MIVRKLIIGAIILLILLVFDVCALCGQSIDGSPTGAPKPTGLIFSPLPAWSSDASQSGNGSPGAFFDFEQLQVVLLVPDPSGAPGLKQVRYDVPNGTNASVTFSVQPAAGGKILYSYWLTDSPQSRQRAQKFAVLLPSHDSTLVWLPCAWTWGMDQTTLPDRTATVPLATMRMAYWNDPAPTANKVFGLEMAAASTYLPGFADAFVEGYVANPLTAQALTRMPGDVAAKAGRFLQPGVGTSSRTVIAPLSVRAQTNA